MPERAIDEGQDSPSLSRLLTNDMMDDTCRVRFWAERQSDGGFWEIEDHVRITPSSSLSRLGTCRRRLKSSKGFYDGVKLISTLCLPPSVMKRSLSWNFEGENVSSESHAGTTPDAGPATVGASDAKAGSPMGRSEDRILVFLKTLGLEHPRPEATRGDGLSICNRDPEDIGKCESHEGRSKYLTHVILRPSSPMRALFELVAELINASEGTLDAYVEDLPCVWQSSPESRRARSQTVRAEEGEGECGDVISFLRPRSSGRVRNDVP